MVVVGGGSMLNLLYLLQAMGVLPGVAFTKSRETLEGSKVGLLSRIPAHPRMDPKLRKTNLAVLSADTLQPRAIVDMRTSVPSTTQASMDRLSKTAFLCRLEEALCDMAAIHFPCDPLIATVRLFDLPPSVTSISIHLGSRIVFYH